MKKKKTQFVKILSSICFIFVIIGITFVSAFSSATTTSETQFLNTPSFSLYCVCTSKSQVEAEAITLGKDIMKSGGAGFVWKKDNYFYTVSSAYENKNDADLVSAELRIKEIDNEIIEIKFNSLNITNPIDTIESKSTFNAGLNIFHTLYKNLFDISVSLDTKIIEETQAMIDVNRSLAIADEVMKNMEIVFNEVENNVIYLLNEAITQANNSLNFLSENQKICDKQSFLSQIRYCYCEISKFFFDFLTKIA